MTRPELLRLLQEEAREILGKDCSHANEGHEFAEIGLDSIDSIDLTYAMERRLSLAMPDESLVGVRTLGQLLDVLEKCDTKRPV